MVDQEAVRKKVDELDELAMGYGTAVFELFAEDYLTEFYDLFRIRDRSPKLIPFEVSFREALRLSCGAGRFEAVAETAERLFGLPKRIMNSPKRNAGRVMQFACSRKKTWVKSISTSGSILWMG